MQTLVAALVAAAGIAGTITLISDGAAPSVGDSMRTSAHIHGAVPTQRMDPLFRGEAEHTYETRRGSRQDAKTIQASSIDSSEDWTRRGMRDSNAIDRTSVTWTSGDWTRRGS
jgi:hypothetical protein